MKLFHFTKTAQKSVQQAAWYEATLKHHATVSFPELYAQLKTDGTGLSSPEAEERLDAFGPNSITSGRKDSRLVRFQEAVINPFNLVLFAIALITFITDVVLPVKKDYVTTSIILGLVFLSSFVSFFQGERSNASAAKLSKMISNRTEVLRDGKRVEILLEEVVPGDIVRLSAGDIIPADVRFLSAKDAFVSQASLTGEAAPVEKFALPKGEACTVTEYENIGFMGSNMVSGSATTIVLATGNNTYLGCIAEGLSHTRAKSSFERGVDAVSGLLIRLMLLIVPAVFLINGFTKGDWFHSLLFALSIAVGLTPEMLPVIMTSTLAKGAINMSKHEVIVKNLGAIQAFGEMDVLCTDKTGTLTEDRIILEKYMDPLGRDDLRVLRHAYLNSYFQTGLKNLIDLAIIRRAEEYGFGDLTESYVKVDEIPFDFSRRRMSTVLRDKGGKRQLITKGAVEEMLAICSYLEHEGEILPLDENSQKIALETYERHNRDGLRVIAVAQKNNVPDIDSFSVSHEADMVLIGFVGFLDPPKESAKAAIDALTVHGVRTVVLTGDSEGVAVKVCRKIGIDTEHRLLGKDVAGMDDAALKEAVRMCNLFSKLSPLEKKRVILALQENGHTVGYMGDGINDTLALRQADVGISVDSAVDIAKETADIILLKKDLMVLEEGVIEGRNTFGNIIKYLKMAVSGNFSNMISVVGASILLPFLPMLPIQLLTQNLLCDFSQMGIPFDSVEEDYIRLPRKWDIASIKRFTMVLGPIGSLFDLLCYGVMWWVIGANNMALAPLFQSGWFVFGTVSQSLIIHMIRTAKQPFGRGKKASLPLLFTTGAVSVIAILIGFTGIAHGMDMLPLPAAFAPWLAVLLLGYAITIQLFKRIYIRRFSEWL